MPSVTAQNQHEHGSNSARERFFRRLVAAGCVVALSVVLGCARSELDARATRATHTTVTTLEGAPGALVLPVKDGSVRFAVIGDSGRGDQPQRDVAKMMVEWRERFRFDFVLMLGDNIYEARSAHDYVAKFEDPYRDLLDAGVTFHAAIGNHDEPSQIHYARFNMGGNRYYTFRKAERRLTGLTAGAGVRFFALDSRSFDPAQLAWLRTELAQSGSVWKICFFHHPFYTSGRYQRGARALRLVVEPIFVAGDVDVVFSGHEHFYERIKPQHGITYFVSGAAGSLRRGDIKPSDLTARGFDTDYHFMLVEISGDEMYFQTISRSGKTVDAGVIARKPVD